MSLAARTTRGVAWNFSEQIARRGLSTLVTLVLANLLSPEDFGLMAMMALFIAISGTLMESGFGEALIRRRETRPDDFNTAFFSNLALGLVAYLLLFLSAPFVAEFYEEPRLVALIRVLGLAVVINSFQVVHHALLTRRLDFKKQLTATLPAVVISGITAVVLAYWGFGVWALVGQVLIAAIFTTVFLWVATGWSPTLVVSRRAFLDMYGFGYKLFLSAFIDTLFRNAYVVVIAKAFSATAAGYYYFADRIRELVLSQLVGAIQKVTYPALANFQDDDVRLKAGYRKIIQVTTFLLFPVMCILAAIAEPLFIALLPEKWLPAVPFLQLMCLAGMLYPVHSINLNILKVKGRSDLFLYLEVFKKTIVALSLIATVRFGITGILVGQIAVSIIGYFPNSYFTNQLIGYGIREQFLDFAPGLFLSLFIAGIVYVGVGSTDWSAGVELLVWTGAAWVAYIMLAFVFGLDAFRFLVGLANSQGTEEVKPVL